MKKSDMKKQCQLFVLNLQSSIAKVYLFNLITANSAKMTAVDRSDQLKDLWWKDKVTGQFMDWSFWGRTFSQHWHCISNPNFVDIIEPKGVNANSAKC